MSIDNDDFYSKIGLELIIYIAIYNNKKIDKKTRIK